VSAGRTFVVGDVHGCIDELERLLDALQPARGDTICFLGDYIDRGPAPKRVIERLIQLRQQGPTCIFLKGNHEDMFLAFLGAAGHHGDVFLSNGGRATLVSYGLSELSAAEVAARLPAAHREFLLSLRNCAYLGRFYCTHAGIRPTRPLDQQTDEDLFWIREEFISAPHPFPYTVLYGHTPGSDVRLHLPFKIGLDTGVVYGNRLSCLELTTRELWQIARGAHAPQRRSLADAFRAAGLDAS
jgi:diadenosine tetraphosphatase ApaH/serine/threonine PP2A family protein phosphatase